MKDLMYKYWGKARKKEDGEGFDYHLLVYHCLDVAAVGKVWLEQNHALRKSIAYALGMNKDDKQLYDTICLFFALHDLGKFDIRFQSKVPDIRNIIWDDLQHNDLLLSQAKISEFDHGKAGYSTFIKHFTQLLSLDDLDYEILDKWKPWIAAVTGHHGIIPINADWHNPSVEQKVIDHDRKVRAEFFRSIISQFGNSNLDIPILSKENQSFVAGFCSITDWIASNELFVLWVDDEISLAQYFKEAVKHCQKTNILQETGIIGCHAAVFAGVKEIIP